MDRSGGRTSRPVATDAVGAARWLRGAAVFVLLGLAPLFDGPPLGPVPRHARGRELRLLEQQLYEAGGMPLLAGVPLALAVACAVVAWRVYRRGVPLP